MCVWCVVCVWCVWCVCVWFWLVGWEYWTLLCDPTSDILNFAFLQGDNVKKQRFASITSNRAYPQTSLIFGRVCRFIYTEIANCSDFAGRLAILATLFRYYDLLIFTLAGKVSYFQQLKDSGSSRWQTELRKWHVDTRWDLYEKVYNIIIYICTHYIFYDYTMSWCMSNCCVVCYCPKIYLHKIFF